MKRAIAEGEFAVLHCFHHRPGDRDYAGTGIFRVHSDGKIGEYRDVLQTMPDCSARDNGMVRTA